MIFLFVASINHLRQGSIIGCSIYQRDWTDHLTFEKKERRRRLIGSFPVGPDSYSAMTSAFLFRMHRIWMRPTPNFAASSLDDCPFSPSLITSTRSDKVRAIWLPTVRCENVHAMSNRCGHF